LGATEGYHTPLTRVVKLQKVDPALALSFLMTIADLAALIMRSGIIWLFRLALD
jgi:hypothetical protein